MADFCVDSVWLVTRRVVGIRIRRHNGTFGAGVSSGEDVGFGPQSRPRASRRLLVTTETDEKAMQAAETAGVSVRPQRG